MHTMALFRDVVRSNATVFVGLHETQSVLCMEKMRQSVASA